MTDKELEEGLAKVICDNETLTATELSRTVLAYLAQKGFGDLKAEREECAVASEKEGKAAYLKGQPWDDGYSHASKNIAAIIRARGTETKGGGAADEQRNLAVKADPVPASLTPSSSKPIWDKMIEESDKLPSSAFDPLHPSPSIDRLRVARKATERDIYHIHLKCDPIPGYHAIAGKESAAQSILAERSAADAVIAEKDAEIRRLKAKDKIGPKGDRCEECDRPLPPHKSTNPQDWPEGWSYYDGWIHCPECFKRLTGQRTYAHLESKYTALREAILRKADQLAEAPGLLPRENIAAELREMVK